MADHKPHRDPESLFSQCSDEQMRDYARDELVQIPQDRINEFLGWLAYREPEVVVEEIGAWRGFNADDRAGREVGWAGPGEGAAVVAGVTAAEGAGRG